MQISLFDIIAVLIVAVLGLRGLSKGFVREFLGKASYIVGLLAALMFAGMAAEALSVRLNIGEWSNVLAFVLIFLAVVVIVRMFALSLNRALRQLRLAKLDGFFGLLLGALEGAIVVSFIVFFLRLQTFFDVETLLQASRTIQLLEPIAPYSIELVTGSL